MVAEFKHQPDAGRQLAAAVVHLGLVDSLVRALQRAEIEQRCQAYRRDGARLDVAGKMVVVVNEGIATGTTVRGAEGTAAHAAVQGGAGRAGRVERHDLQAVETGRRCGLLVAAGLLRNGASMRARVPA
ncbi:MAG: hypothetical protein H7340_11430 [Variovorax sp.]|nr:hypothetical protein [Variovorax sp.]